jgi:cysteine desulfurase
MKIRYFDHSATTAVDEKVLEAMLPYFTNNYGNPSSVYNIGVANKEDISIARMKVASILNCKVNEIYFTSCGSESDNMAVKGIVYASINKDLNSGVGALEITERKHIITSKIEHPAIINTCKNLEKKGFDATYLNVDEEGFVDLAQLINSIKENTVLISIMFANNEIGTIQNIEEIASIAKKYNIVFHTDAVQACGNVPIDVKKMGIDMLSLSGHKLNAPKGVGALYVRNGIEFERFLDGGHQEKNKRAGTENVAGIVGLGKACEMAKKNMPRHVEYLKSIRDYYIQKIENEIPEAKLNGSRKIRLPGNANFSFPSIDGQELLLKLDQLGICVSSGSACSSGETAPSYVLTAIGLNEKYARGAIRATFGEDNTNEDVDFLVESIKNKIKSI